MYVSVEGLPGVYARCAGDCSAAGAHGWNINKQRPPVFPGTQYGHFFGSVLERCGEGAGGLVFGTLLGPEATGPCHGFVCFLGGGVVVWVLFVSGFLAAPITHDQP